ncbi:hypothetical protein M8C21_027974 [Ambrosia artemisiifolia]|uniref:Uncharacterized protein n=1 Tax=Ambrosia artemisiifolia TaxID=4212 RepID=A0AAD5GJR2_AMBAR|nr:hypothetical protein M8C21_027974 [Ambrosia artemisiifolia]
MAPERVPGSESEDEEYDEAANDVEFHGDYGTKKECDFSFDLGSIRSIIVRAHSRKVQAFFAGKSSKDDDPFYFRLGIYVALKYVFSCLMGGPNLNQSQHV